MYSDILNKCNNTNVTKYSVAYLLISNVESILFVHSGLII